MRSQRGGFVTGLVLGLLVGLGVALGVALYITKAPVPFINKLPQRSPEQDAAEAERNKRWDPNAPLAGKNPARPAARPASSASATDNDAAAPAAVASAQGAASAPPRAMPSTAAASTPATAASAARVPREARDPAAILAGQAGAAAAAKTAAPASKPASAAQATFFVQAGAYARTDDAEAQRAKLALIGMTARVTEREQSGRTVYRVRLGPFDSREAAGDVQGQLAGAGVEANLVRVER